MSEKPTGPSTFNVSLSRELASFVRERVESGLYASASEVVREAMRRYIAEDTKVEALRAALQEGLDSGPATDFDFDVWMEKHFPETE